MTENVHSPLKVCVCFRKTVELNFLFVGGCGRVWQQTDENTEKRGSGPAKHPTKPSSALLREDTQTHSAASSVYSRRVTQQQHTHTEVTRRRGQQEDVSAVSKQREGRVGGKWLGRSGRHQHRVKDTQRET